MAEERDRDRELREALRRVRKEAGISQDAVAEAIGSAQGNISRWERTMNPTLTEAAAAFDAMGYSFELVIRRRGEDDVDLRTTTRGAFAARLVERLDDLQWERAKRLLRTVRYLGDLHWNTIALMCAAVEEEHRAAIDRDASGDDPY